MRRPILWFVLFLLPILLSGSLLAQNGNAQKLFVIPGRFWIRDVMPSPILVGYAGQDVFVLQRGVLAKYSSATHELEGSLPLFDKPVDTLPPDIYGNYQLQQKYIFDRFRHFLSPTMIVTDTDIQILIGDQYFRVDPKTLKSVVSAPLISLDDQTQRMDMYVWPNNVLLVSHGTATYRAFDSSILRGQPIPLAMIDQTTGKVLAHADLPASMQDVLPLVNDGVEGLDSIWQFTQAPMMKLVVNDDGVFVLREGVLAKFDLKTLASQGDPLKLYGPIAKLENPDQATDAEVIAYNVDHLKRQLPATMFAYDHDLFIVIGDDLFRIDTQKFTLTEQTALLTTPPEKQIDRLVTLFQRGEQAVSHLGTQIYLSDSNQVTSVDGLTGKVETKPLPKIVTPDLTTNQAQPRAPYARGVLEKTTEENGTVWVVHDATNGDFMLTGDALNDLLAKIDQPDGAFVIAAGTFTKDDNDSLIVKLLFAQPLSVQGLLTKTTGDKGAVWTISDAEQGDLVLTGNQLDDLLAKLDTPDGALVTASGQLHQQGKQRLLTATNLSTLPTLTIQGLAARVKPDGQAAYWTVKTTSGVVYTLVGDGVKNLDNMPRLNGKRIAITGTFTQDIQAVPLTDKAYLVAKKIEVVRANHVPLPPAFPMALVATQDVLHMTRAGAVVMLDPLTLDMKASKDLFPGAATQDNKRKAPVTLSVSEKGLFIAIGKQLFSLHGDLQGEMQAATIELPANATLNGVLAGNAYCVNTKTEELTVYNTLDVSEQFTIKLPPEMTARLFPESSIIKEPK